MSQWAPDPYRRFELRYYDGTRWTEHVSAGGVQSTDAPVAEAPFSRQPLGFARGGNSPGALLPVAYCATALGLAIAGKPAR